MPMLTPAEIWPMIAGAGAVVFGAGQLVEKIRNGKYVRKDMCAQIHAQEKERWERIDRNLEKIWKHIDGQHMTEVHE
jgi:hypothetical protein